MRKTFTAILVVLTILLLASCASTQAQKKASGEEYLSLWTEDAPLKKELIAYMEAITDPSSPDYIPVEYRVAVFDMDGTLLCETDRDYFDHTLLAYRVTEDKSYADKASDFERQVADTIIEKSKTSSPVSGLDVDHGKAVATAFKGMTAEQFNDYIQEFKELPMPGYEGMKRGDSFYLPMIQVIDYLQANDFTVYIISGTDRYISRAIFYGNDSFDIPNSQIIGSDVLLVATNQNGADGLEYTFTAQDQVILGGEFLIKNLKMNKVSAIVREIGVQPVLSFGNSTGDAAMANYVISNNPYRSYAFMLCCDDTVRENGNVEKANSMYDLCAQNNWIPVSMKNDWTTIYGDGVTRR
ncbi:MAG: haloacid dehalogenase-like hydrolase [Sphaerochaetaceae bacterium]|nr:haloacid dehalogenase-like hydrolase [Sphaerochaetaceae bacterium]